MRKCLGIFVTSLALLAVCAGDTQAGPVRAAAVARAGLALAACCCFFEAALRHVNCHHEFILVSNAYRDQSAAICNKFAQSSAHVRAADIAEGGG
jgi:hypothetical protein